MKANDFLGDLGIDESILLSGILKSLTNVKNELSLCFFSFMVFDHARPSLWFKIPYRRSLLVKLFFLYFRDFIKIVVNFNLAHALRFEVFVVFLAHSRRIWF